ncbi:DUF2637 domain-containing protein [Actinomadura barringtoniae]|uniref:DUF2637 domain-containing protein n=1 Tax=Actinomadura barringtoniae TaxID=1427535 RepID=A0A939P7M1_9ACTN|nr:DUF2637 domain-containing protein [Actinomadura barringtoniae]MBO2447125.1 DUF2637 domain-containing protein [Actinomadura barringtoniae]
MNVTLQADETLSGQAPSAAASSGWPAGPLAAGLAPPSGVSWPGSVTATQDSSLGIRDELIPQRAPTAAKVAAAIITPLVLTLAVLGGAGSFTTVRDMARPWFADLAWIVPVGLDVGILALLAWDLLAEYVGLPWPVLRWVAWAFIGATIAVNSAAADGDPIGVIVHGAMPVLFIVVVEGIRHLVNQWTGLTTGTRIEPVPKARWMLAPISTALLWRRMVLWHITGYRHGLAAEYRHLLAVSRLQEEYGRWTWRWRAPLAERLALRHLPAEISGLRVEDEVEDVPDEPGPVDQQYRPEDENDASARPGWITGDLLAAAQEILTRAEREGVRVSKQQFGRRLRDAGFTIANGRLATLRAAANVGD